MAHPDWLKAQERNTCGQDASTWRFGQIFLPLWGTFWDPKGARRGPKACTRGLQRGPSSGTLKMHHFRVPLGAAHVSSRLGESTVFKVSGELFFCAKFTVLGCPWDSKWLILGGQRLKIGTLGAKVRPPSDFSRFPPPSGEPLWEPKGAIRGPKALIGGHWEGPPDRTLKMNHFQFSPGGLK